MSTYYIPPYIYSSVQSLSRVRLTLCDPMDCSMPGFPGTSSQNLLKLMSMESVMPSNHLILCCPLLFPPSTSPSIRVLSNESTFCIRWPKYWNFSFSISPSSEYIQGWFSLQLTDLISLLSKGLSTVFSSTTILMFFSHVAGKMKWKKDKKLMAQCGPNSCLFSPSLDSSLGGNTRDH